MRKTYSTGNTFAKAYHLLYDQLYKAIKYYSQFSQSYLTLFTIERVYCILTISLSNSNEKEERRITYDA